MDHLGIREFMVLGFCIGGPFIWNLLKRAPGRVVAAVLAQPSGFRPTMPDLFYQNNIKGWGPPLCERRPDVTMAQIDAFLNKMYRSQRRFRVHRDARFREAIAGRRSSSCPTTCRPTPTRWRWRARISRPMHKSASIRGRRTRSRSNSRCATCARSSKQTGRRVRRSDRWPPPRSNLPFRSPPG